MKPVNFAASKWLVGFKVPLEVIRVCELVKYTDGTHLIGGAAQHAPVRRVDRKVAIFEIGDSDPQLSSFEHCSEFLFTLAYDKFKRSALGDVQKSDD
jgi:hypothetical protein